MADNYATIIVKLIIDPIEGHPAESVMEMICEVFGKEERKDRPRARLVLIELEQK